MLIIIEGNIGAGKSSLTKALIDKIGAKAMFEPVETNPYLESFYQEPKRWALEMQYWLMARRLEMHEEAIRHIAKTGQAVVMDRSIYGDTVFAKMNWLSGNIDDRGFKAYMQHRKLYVDRLLTPNITLFLEVAPEECHRRILQLRKRTCEAAVPLDYLRGLDQCYRELLDELKERGSDVYQVEWNQFGTIENVFAQLELNERFRIFWRGYAQTQLNGVRSVSQPSQYLNA